MGYNAQIQGSYTVTQFFGVSHTRKMEKSTILPNIQYISKAYIFYTRLDKHRLILKLINLAESQIRMSNN